MTGSKNVFTRDGQEFKVIDHYRDTAREIPEAWVIIQKDHEQPQQKNTYDRFYKDGVAYRPTSIGYGKDWDGTVLSENPHSQYTYQIILDEDTAPLAGTKHTEHPTAAGICMYCYNKSFWRKP